MKPGHLKLSGAVWSALLVLAPLALAAGVWLILRNDPNVRLGLLHGRQEAFAIARQAAASRGIEASGWDGYLATDNDNNRYFYYRLRQGREADAAQQLAPALTIKVMLVAPDRRERFEVRMSPTGRVIGYTHTLPNSQAFTDPGEAVTRKIAEAALRARPEAVAIPAAAAPEMQELAVPGGVMRRYVWNWPAASLPELERRIVILIRGSEVVSEEIQAGIERKFAEANLQSNLAGLIIFGTVYGLSVLVMLAFGVYRFAERARQKEVSYGRVLLLAVLSAGVFILFMLQTDVAVYRIVAQNPQASPLVSIFMASLMYLVAGLLVGMAYGSGEGDIREAYPGKLTSLDALLTGRIFSRNVARAVIFSVAIGCWGVLLVQLAVLPWAGNPRYGWQIVQADGMFARWPWLTHLYGWMSYSILPGVTGLLLPLPFLHRRLRNQQVIIALVFLLALGSVSVFSTQVRPWLAVFLTAAVLAATLLVGFFKCDLQTAFISVGIPSLITVLVQMIAQPSPSIRLAGLISTGIALSFIALELFFFFKGRWYSEAQVRPLYASNLVERLAMQAEVSAAREAQIRLLPQRLPRLPQLAIAAACQPAHEVGGDFYDFFQLDENRLGVFIAEGGGQGLASALSIAFAKGWLMPRLKSETRGDDSPAEIVRGLQARLSAMIESETGFGFAYAVIDTSDGSLRYARTGSWPRLLIINRDMNEAARQPKEREIRFSNDRSGARTFSVNEGTAFLAPGDTIALFTNGIAESWADNQQPDDQAIVRVFSANTGETQDELCLALDKTMSDSLKRAHQKGVQDDLTAVIIRLESLNEDTAITSSALEEQV